MQPVAQVVFTLMPDGTVRTQANGPNLAALLAAIELGKINLVAEMQKQAAGPQIAKPPAGFDPGRVVPHG